MQTYVQRKTEQKRKSFTVYSVYVYIYIFIYIFIVKLLLCFFLNRDALFHLSPVNLQIEDEEEEEEEAFLPVSLHCLSPVMEVGGGARDHLQGGGGGVVVWPPQIRATPGCAAPSPDTKVNVKLFNLLKRLDTETGVGGGE